MSELIRSQPFTLAILLKAIKSLPTHRQDDLMNRPLMMWPHRGPDGGPVYPVKRLFTHGSWTVLAIPESPDFPKDPDPPRTQPNERLIGIDREAQVVALTNILDETKDKFGEGFNQLSFDLVAEEMYARGVRIPSEVGPMEPVQAPNVESEPAGVVDAELISTALILEELSKFDPVERSRMMVYLRSRVGGGL